MNSIITYIQIYAHRYIDVVLQIYYCTSSTPKLVLQTYYKLYFIIQRSTGIQMIIIVWNRRLVRIIVELAAWIYDLFPKKSCYCLLYCLELFMLHEFLLQPFSLQFELKERSSYIKIINSNSRENEKRHVLHTMRYSLGILFVSAIIYSQT